MMKALDFDFAIVRLDLTIDESIKTCILGSLSNLIQEPRMT